MPCFRREAITGEFDIISHQLPAIDRRLMVRCDPFMEVEDIRGVVQRFPFMRSPAAPGAIVRTP